MANDKSYNKKHETVMRRTRNSVTPGGLSKAEAQAELSKLPVVFDHIKALRSDKGRQQILELLSKKKLQINTCIPRVQKDPYNRDFYAVVKCHEKGFTFFRVLVKTCTLEYVMQVIQAGLEIENNFLPHTAYLINDVPHAGEVVMYLLNNYLFDQRELKETLGTVCCCRSPRKLEFIASLLLLIEDLNHFKTCTDPIERMMNTKTLDPAALDKLMKAGLDMNVKVKDFSSASNWKRRVDLITHKIDLQALQDSCTLLISGGYK